MATVKKELYHCLLNYYSIFPNALSVFDHWFCVIGNGYEWKNGELVTKYNDYDDESKFFKAKNIKEAVINCLNYELIESWKENGLNTRFFDIYANDKIDTIKYIVRDNENAINNVKLIFDTDNRMKDFSIENAKIGRDNFKFYPLCNYSAICNLPDNIKPDWLEAANTMYKIMKENSNLINEDYHWMEIIGKRLEELNNR